MESDSAIGEAVSPSLALNDGHSVPQIGLGVYQTPDDEVTEVVSFALRNGYRHIDTASLYGNERGVGEGVRVSGLPRDEVFVTSKVWFTENGYDSALRSFDQSMTRLGFDYLDMFLIHWPAPQNDRYVDTWRALIRLRDEGRVRSIGVSNFHAEHIERVVGETGVIPAVNQIELHPGLQQDALRRFDEANGILTQAWSPFARGTLLGGAAGPTLEAVAQKHERTPGQVVIRWGIQAGASILPKSVTPTRIVENIHAYDFELDEDDLRSIAALETGRRLGLDPNDFN